MNAPIMTIEIRVDRDWQRLFAYRETLREIAKDAAPWETSGPAALAAEMLRRFDDLEPGPDVPA